MYKELFYWMYTYLKRVKTNDMPAFSAICLIGLLQSFNLMTIGIIVFRVFLLNLEMDLELGKYLVVGLSFVVLSLNFLFLYPKGKAICEKYEVLSSSRKVKGKILFWIYSLGTIILAYATLIYM